jgi:hypothetical protein
MVKYGVPTPEAAWAMMVGIPFRDLAIRIADGYLRTKEETGFKDFREWLSSLDAERLQHEFGIDSPVLEDIVEALSVVALNPLLEKHSSAKDILPHENWIVGIRHKEERIRTAKSARIGQSVTLEREYGNRFDHNAVIVLLDGNELGYLNRNLAQLIAPDIDAGTLLTGKIVQFMLDEVPKIQISLKVEDTQPREHPNSEDWHKYEG